jgi:hypothetical protein
MIHELLVVLSFASASTPLVVSVEKADELNTVLTRLQAGMTVEVAEGSQRTPGSRYFRSMRITLH